MHDSTSDQIMADVEGHSAEILATAPFPDLNALLAHEQTAIMSAEAATDITVRDEARETARQLRDLVDQTAFPAREPHDFDRNIAAEPEADDYAAEFERLKNHVEDMEDALAFRFPDGGGGGQNKNFVQRSRMISQARGRLDELVKLRTEAEMALNNRGIAPT